MMKKLLILTALFLIAACGDGGTDPVEPPVATTATVSMPAFSFTPFTTEIGVGGRVIFEFPAEPHNVIFERKTGAPTDIPTTTRQNIARTFAVVGNFPYDCLLHPGMSGLIVVK